jgi:hypothetical protein
LPGQQLQIGHDRFLPSAFLVTIDGNHVRSSVTSAVKRASLNSPRIGQSKGRMMVMFLKKCVVLVTLTFIEKIMLAVRYASKCQLRNLLRVCSWQPIKGDITLTCICCVPCSRPRCYRTDQKNCPLAFHTCGVFASKFIMRSSRNNSMEVSPS